MASSSFLRNLSRRIIGDGKGKISTRLTSSSSSRCCCHMQEPSIRSLSTASHPSPPQPVQTRVTHMLPQLKTQEPFQEGLEAKFAIINLKTKQYKITKDDIIVSDKIEGLNPGDFYIVSDVHLVGTPDYTVVGRPFVKDAKVKLQVEEQTKDAKVIVFKKKRRKNYRRKQGFRREVTILRVLDIES